MIICFLNACWPQLLEILMSKISLKYIPIHVYIFFKAHRGDKEYEIVQL